MKKSKVLVCFAKHKKWYSNIVLWLTRSKVNHVFVEYYNSFWRKNRAVDIDNTGVCDKPTASFDSFENLERWECSISLNDSLKQMEGFVGTTKYDWLGMFWGVIRLFFLRIFGMKINKTIQSKKRLFCSEFVAEVLKKAGVPGTENWITSDFSPGDLKKFVETNECFKRIS